jgi:hypothetical protein
MDSHHSLETLAMIEEKWKSLLPDQQFEYSLAMARRFCISDRHELVDVLRMRTGCYFSRAGNGELSVNQDSADESGKLATI